MGTLENKTAVITGGGTGIGLATTRRLVAEGAHVFITGRRKTVLDAVVESLGPAAVTAVPGDLAAPGDLDRLYVTSAAMDLDTPALSAAPLSGSLIALEPGVRGLPCSAFVR